MQLKFEILFLCIGGFIRIADLGTDIWYLITQEFHSTLIYYVFIASILAPSGILLLVFIFTGLVDCCKGSHPSCFKLTLFLLFILGDSIGLNYFVFTFILCRSTFFLGDFFIIDAMFRISALINCLFQSTPQIVLQVYNNQQFDSWTILNIISISTSGISMIYTCTKLTYALDKVKQYESVSLDPTSRNATIRVINNSSMVKEEEPEEGEIRRDISLKSENIDEDEVYSSE